MRVTERRGVCAIKPKPFLVVSNRALFSHFITFFLGPFSIARTPQRSSVRVANRFCISSPQRECSISLHDIRLRARVLAAPRCNFCSIPPQKMKAQAANRSDACHATDQKGAWGGGGGGGG